MNGMLPILGIWSNLSPRKMTLGNGSEAAYCIGWSHHRPQEPVVSGTQSQQVQFMSCAASRSSLVCSCVQRASFAHTSLTKTSEAQTSAKGNPWADDDETRLAVRPSASDVCAIHAIPFDCRNFVNSRLFSSPPPPSPPPPPFKLEVSASCNCSEETLNWYLSLGPKCITYCFLLTKKPLYHVLQFVPILIYSEDRWENIRHGPQLNYSTISEPRKWLWN